MEYINKKRNDKHEKILPIKSQKNVNAKQVCQKISIIQDGFKMIVKQYHTVNINTGTTSIMEVNHSHRKINLYVTSQQYAERLMYLQENALKPRYFNRLQRKAIMDDLIKRGYKVEYQKWGVLQ